LLWRITATSDYSPCLQYLTTFPGLQHSGWWQRHSNSSLLKGYCFESTMNHLKHQLWHSEGVWHYCSIIYLKSSNFISSKNLVTSDKQPAFMCCTKQQETQQFLINIIIWSNNFRGCRNISWHTRRGVWCATIYKITWMTCASHAFLFFLRVYAGDL
jgi:hypothetical protein